MLKNETEAEEKLCAGAGLKKSYFVQRIAAKVPLEFQHGSALIRKYRGTCCKCVPKLTSESLIESFSGVVMEGSTLMSPAPTPPPSSDAPGLAPRTLWLLLDELLLASGGSDVVFESSSSSSSLADPSKESPANTTTKSSDKVTRNAWEGMQTGGHAYLPGCITTIVQDEHRMEYFHQR
jgi:hypothetical protein